MNKVARGNEIDSHSSCLFAKLRSGTYPRFCLFVLLPPGTYPRFLGSPGTYPPVFAHWTFVGTCRQSAEFSVVAEARLFVNIKSVFRISFCFIHSGISFFENLGIVILLAVVSGNSNTDTYPFFIIWQQNIF